ncbi:MAG: PDZ domain-containing protein [Akkermansia sp.]|nr:PDZ domain-containing protein [Akkermansia sp.]
MKHFLILLSLASLLRAEGVPYSGLAAANQEGGGVLVAAVAHFGPADRGGVNAGDTLLSMDGKAICTKEELYAYLSTAKPGQQITFTLKRRHLTLKRQITIADRLTPQAVFEPSDRHLDQAEWAALEHQQYLIAAQLASEAPDWTQISAAFAEMRRISSPEERRQYCHLLFWGKKSLLHIYGNEDSLVAAESFLEKGRPEELYRLSGRGAVRQLPEHLRKRIRRQMETLPDFAGYFSIHITEKQ